MSLTAAAAEDDHIPADIDWQMLDKSRFFFLGAVLFSGVSAALYPIVVLKTRQQVTLSRRPFQMASSILRAEGCRGFYRGFGTSLVGTIPARALYMGALELTKTHISTLTSSSALANAAAGLSAAMAAQLVWTPVDVISQRLMIQGGGGGGSSNMYSGGIDAFRKILISDGLKGLYRGFGISILTYAPSNAVWWASYSIAHRTIRGLIEEGGGVAVQGLSAMLASGASAVVTMPLDTVKTRLQVRGDKKRLVQTVTDLVKEGGGLGACYRGLGPRWASMSLSATTMITTYEFLKRMSTKNQEGGFW